jgi:hypothetical protein
MNFNVSIVNGVCKISVQVFINVNLSLIFVKKIILCHDSKAAFIKNFEKGRAATHVSSKFDTKKKETRLSSYLLFFST